MGRALPSRDVLPELSKMSLLLKELDFKWKVLKNKLVI
jgi:hypothetical protein